MQHVVVCEEWRRVKESEGSRVSGERECEGCCEEEREGKEGTVSEHSYMIN